MNYKYSSHSLEQLKRRQISKTNVDEVLNNPDQIKVIEKCTKVFQNMRIKYDKEGNITGIEVLNASSKMLQPDSIIYEFK